MTDYLINGFEDAGAAWNSVTGTVQGTVKKTGSYAGAFTSYTYARFNTVATTLHIEGAFRFSALPADDEEASVIRIYNTDDTCLAELMVGKADGENYFLIHFLYPSEDWVGLTYGSLEIDTWYTFALRFKQHGSTGEYKAYVAGTLLASATGLNTSGAVNTYIEVGQPYSNFTTTIFLDDVRITDLNPAAASVRLQYSSTPPAVDLTVGGDVSDTVSNGGAIDLAPGNYTLSVPETA